MPAKKCYIQSHHPRPRSPLLYRSHREHFKPRWHTHKQSFKNEELKKATCLSTYVWEKGLGTEPDMKWEIFDRAPPYQPGQKVCQLCLTEKLHIIEQCKKKNCLNQRSEICQICRHKASYRLGRVKGATWQCVAKSWTVIITLLTSCPPDSFYTKHCVVNKS